MNTKICDFVNKKGVHLAQLNIRSLWNKIDITRQMILNSGLDMISLSETWLSSQMNSQVIDIPGYNCIRHDRSWTENNNIKKGGGLCAYVKSDINVSYLDFLEYNVSTKDMELLWISLILPNSKRIIIGNAYRPPQGNVKTFCDTLDTLLSNIKDRQTGNFEVLS